MGNFKVTTGDKTVDVICDGVFTPSDAQAFVAEFQKQTASITPANCSLNLDASNLAVSPAEMHEILKGCLNMYKAMGFGKVTLNVGTNVIVKMQVQRLANEIGFNSFEVK